MGVLARLGALACILAGCYGPDIRNCTLRCETSADCALDQVCGSDSMCIEPDAGPCIASIATDAPIATDAEIAADAQDPEAAIDVTIAGAGTVTIGSMTCMSMAEGMGADGGHCMLLAPVGLAATAVATGKGMDMFVGWTSTMCATQGASCTFTPTGPTPLSVQFTKHP